MLLVYQNLHLLFFMESAIILKISIFGNNDVHNLYIKTDKWVASYI